MRKHIVKVSHLACIGFFLALMSCANFSAIDRPVTQYTPYGTDQVAGQRSPDLLVLVAFSGGGTRAAAFSYGVLKTLADTKVMTDKGQRSLLHEVDVISSVSGGSFTPAYFDLICADLDQYPLSRAVTASSAVPVLFTPITVKSYAGTCGFELPTWVAEAREDERNSTRKAEARGLMSYMDREKRPWIHLVDGGIADNLGLRAYYTTFSLAGNPREVFNALGHPGVRHVLIISVNSFAHKQEKWPLKRAAPGLAETMGAISSDQIGRYNYDTIDIVRYSFDYWTRKISTPQLPVTFDFVEVSFNAVHDADRRQALNDIGTNFKLKDDEVDLLIEAADEVLRSSPEFRSFLARINGQVK